MRLMLLTCLIAFVATSIGCNASTTELGPNASSEGLEEPTPEDIIDSIPPEGQKHIQESGGVPDSKPPKEENDG